MSNDLQQGEFLFDQPISSQKIEGDQWILAHNRQMERMRDKKMFPSQGVLLALDRQEAKTNAVYLLRGMLSRGLSQALSDKTPSSKIKFVKTLTNEIRLKKTTQDVSTLVRNALLG